MNNPLISIITPCYNGAKYLRETLDCLQKQTIQEWECIIVNDGSNDGSLEIMKEYAAKDSRYKYIDKKNEGTAVARNIAIKASHGKYILPLDADDIIEPTYAEKAINYLEHHVEVKLVYCKANYFGDRNEAFELPDFNYDNLKWKNQIFCSAIFRHHDFDKTKGYNPNMRAGNEDWDFWLSFLAKDADVYCIPETLFYYRQHEDSRNSKAIKASELLPQMVINHLDLYKPYLSGVFEAPYLKREVDVLLNCNSYRIGRAITSIYRWIKSIGFK